MFYNNFESYHYSTKLSHEFTNEKSESLLKKVHAKVAK